MADLTQNGFRFGVNYTGTSNAEVILYITADENAIGDYVSNQLHIRIQVQNEDTITQDDNWQLYYNTVDNPATATRVTTGTSVVKLVDDTNITGGNDLVEDDIVDHPFGFTWQDGEYTETDSTNKLQLANGFYTDFQWVIQFDSNAALGTPYYFFLRLNNDELNTYPATADLPTVILATEKVRYVNTDSTPSGNGTTNATTGDNRAYASLNEWEIAEQDDLRPFYIPNIVYCSGSAVDSTSVDILGWETDATSTITIKGADQADFSGRITDLRIYNKGLTAAEATALYETSAQLDNRGNLWC